MGAILGIVLHVAASDVEFVQNVLINGVFYVIGQGFIRLMQMLVVPLVFCSLICGSMAIGDTKTLIVHPESTLAAHSTEQEKIDAAVFDDMIRISVGIEDIEDLKQDFTAAIQNTAG